MIVTLFTFVLIEPTPILTRLGSGQISGTRINRYLASGRNIFSMKMLLPLKILLFIRHIK